MTLKLLFLPNNYFVHIPCNDFEHWKNFMEKIFIAVSIHGIWANTEKKYSLVLITTGVQGEKVGRLVSNSINDKGVLFCCGLVVVSASLDVLVNFQNPAKSISPAFVESPYCTTCI